MVSRILLLCLLLLFPYGLSQPDRLHVGTALTPEAEADVLVWTAYTGPSLDWLQAELDVFGRASGISIAIEQYTLGELRRHVVLADDDGTVPDVLVGIPHDDIDELVEGNLLLDMSSYATADYLKDLPESASSAFMRNERLVGLALTLDGPALIVNTDLVTRLPRTYGELLGGAARNAGTDVQGIAFDVSNYYFAHAWFRGHGASVFGPGGEEPALNSPEAVRAAQALQALRFDAGIMEAGMNYSRADELFATGRLMYTFNGPWSLTRYFQAGINVAVMPMPEVVPGIPFAGFMTVYGVLIPAGTENRTAAANVSKWLVRPEAQVRLAEQAGRIPSSIRAVGELEHDIILHGFGMALRHAEATPTTELMALLWQPLGRLLNQLDSAPMSASEIGELLLEVVDEVREP